MTEPDDSQRHEQLIHLVHDIRQHLYAVGLSTMLLKNQDTDKQRTVEICDSIERELKEADRLIRRFDDIASKLSK